MHCQEIVKNHECEYNRRIIGRMRGGKLWHLLLQVYAFISSLFSYSRYKKEEWTQEALIVSVKLHVADSFYNIHVRLRQ